MSTAPQIEDNLSDVLLTTSNDAIVVISPPGEILKINPAAELLHNWEKSKVIGKQFKSFCKASKLPHPQDKHSEKHPLIYTHKNKKYLFSWNTIKLENGNLLFIGKNLTELQAIKEHAYSLDWIIKHAPDLIYWKDRNSVHLGCNDRFAELAGLKSRDEVAGKMDKDFAWSRQAASFIADDREVIESGQAKTDIEDLLPTAGGELAVVITNKVPLRDLDGNVIGVLGTATDITERKKAEQGIVLAKEKAESANQAKSNFLATISHELRTPLNAVMGMAQILKNRSLNPEQQEYVDIIVQSVVNLLALINDILDFSKLEAGKLEITHKPFNLHKLVDEVIISIRHLVEDKHIKLLAKFDKRIPEIVLGDELRVRQVIINLITNAIKFTEEGHIKVIVKCESKSKDKTHIRISIEDTGIGIPDDKLEHIFGRFTQVESQYSRRFSGVGLGLSICKQLVSAMKGDIGVESQLRKGSKFYFVIPFSIPAKEETHSPTQEISVSDEAIDLQAYVLLVEDNVLNQKVAKILLEELGCIVDIAENGQAAFRYFNKNDYDLIFMDVGLPDMDGLQVTRTIRSDTVRGKSIPIISLTAHALEEDRKNCLKAGASEVLIKPILQDELAKIIKKWVKNPKGRK